MEKICFYDLRRNTEHCLHPPPSTHPTTTTAAAAAAEEALLFYYWRTYNRNPYRSSVNGCSNGGGGDRGIGVILLLRVLSGERGRQKKGPFGVVVAESRKSNSMKWVLWTMMIGAEDGEPDSQDRQRRSRDGRRRTRRNRPVVGSLGVVTLWMRLLFLSWSIAVVLGAVGAASARSSSSSTSPVVSSAAVHSRIAATTTYDNEDEDTPTTIAAMADDDDDDALVISELSLDDRDIEEFDDTDHIQASSFMNANPYHSKEDAEDDATITTTEDGFMAESSSNEKVDDDGSKGGVIVVSTVDGTIAGLCRTTGRTLWKRVPPSRQPTKASSSAASMSIDARKNFHNDGNDDTMENGVAAGALLDWEPLVSTTTTSGNSKHQKWRTSAVPSLVDGIVYLTTTSATAKKEKKETHETGSRQISDETEEEETVTTRVRDLVRRAPFVDRRGRVYTAQSHSVALAVDTRTGETVKTMANHHHRHDSRDGIYNDNNTKEGDSGHILWMGRVDYTVSIHEPRTGELDVQFTTSELMSVHDMMLSNQGVEHHTDRRSSTGSSSRSEIGRSDVEEQVGDFVASSTALASNYYHGSSMRGKLTSLQDQSKLRNIIATPSGNVAFLNPETNQIAWVAEESFATPVAYALDSTTGLSLGVEFVPDAAVPHGSIKYVSEEMQKHLDLLINDHRHMRQVDSNDEAIIVGSLPNSGQLFALPLAQTQTQLDTPHVVKPLFSTSTTLEQPKLHQGSKSIIPGRLHHNQKQGINYNEIKHDQHPQQVHYTQQRYGAHYLHACTPGNPSYPKCDRRNSISSRRSHANFLSDSAGSPFDDENGAVVPFYHPDYGFHYIPPDQFYILYPELHNSRKRYRKKLLRLLGSWLPPLVALIFVSSFELGRRKRQKDDMDVKDDKARDSGVDVQSVVSPGVIKVNEDIILGHGGHGTIVYKGVLEGRQVAVKRMLKTYNASADREIALLIESDGHPNVVRYFLKEVRGDFVYLALELCDLSLHDLIGHIRHRLERGLSNDEKRIVFVASKAILYQIAKGAEHLHKLMIVHRDLKPANILLGHSKQYDTKDSTSDSVCDKFEHGGYIAKISDMGLGKQLVGQSSYGGESLQVSIRGQERRGQSSIVGMGPGSVGWQAPEVMALRMPSDVSIKSDGSTMTNDPASEMSPLDVSPKARTSRAVDIFSLGCIFYSMLVPGSHPFGEWYEREANVMNNRPKIDQVKSISREAHDLINAMLNRRPSARPTASQICEHPFFWSSERRLNFLCDLSDRLEIDAIGSDSSAFISKLVKIERNAAEIVGTSWDTSLHDDLISNVQRFRTYDPSSVRDLLRLIRNKYHHFDELSSSLRDVIGSKTEGLTEYFEAKFPGLLIHCFNVCREIFASEDDFSAKYCVSAMKNATSFTKLATLSVERNAATYHEPVALSEIATISVANDTRDGNETNALKQLELNHDLDRKPFSEEKTLSEPLFESSDVEYPCVDGDLIVWQGSSTAQTLQCRGWNRSDDEWQRRFGTAVVSKRRDDDLVRCAEDSKFRTRLCNHWDTSLGTFCPMRKKNKCIFAHGPVELRVKEAKRNRWGKLVDANGDNNNPNHSGGEDSYGAARSIEHERKQEGKWNSEKPNHAKGKKSQSTKKKQPAEIISQS